MKYVALLALASACATPAPGSVDVDPDEAASADGKADGAASLPDIQCDGVPDAGPKEKLRHTSSKITVALGGETHRGFDLVVNAASETQVLAGAISYGLFDKALEDEDVDVFACRRYAWRKVGRARTDDEGRFALTLEGSDRLPLGMRDLYVSVAGDRTGARFLAVVAGDDTELAVSDIDGTLTTNEIAVASNIFGIDTPIHDGAVDGWQHIAATGRVPVYVTARAQRSTQSTREWLAFRGLPRGPVRLAPHVLLPGSSTVEFKTNTLTALAAELPIALGVGNRQSDVEAYTAAGIAPDRIFVKLPEFELELADALAAGQAVGFTDYPGPLANM